MQIPYLFPKTILFGSMALSVSCNPSNPDATCSKEPNPTTSDYQNIVVIVSDDHTAHVAGAYGNEVVKTPNLDAMAENGTLFSRAYCNSPICSASRQSIITGRYAHATGVNLLSTPFPEEQVTIAEHLAALGYATGVVGKTHFNNDLPHGFQEVMGPNYRDYLESINPPPLPDSIRVRPRWSNHAPPEEWLNAESATSGQFDEHDQGTWYSRQAIDFLNRHKEGKFLLWIGFHEPHAPFNFPVEYQGKYNPVSQLPYPLGSAEDDEHLPEIFRDMAEQDERGVIRSYYTSVEFLDKNIGLIIDAIEQMGLEDNTLVVYVSDNGYLLHHHKRFEKHSMWEESVHVPLIIRGYGNNRRLDQMIELVDLTPTLLDAVGAEPMTTAQGKSVMPLLKEQTDTHRDLVFSTFLPDNKAMVRTDRWKLIYTTGKSDLALGYQTGFGAPGMHYRLYDMVNDPGETTNLANLEEYKDVVDSLKMEMLGVFRQTHPLAVAVPDSITPESQLTIFCEPLDVGHKGY